MKRLYFYLALVLLAFSETNAQTYENNLAKPLGIVLQDIAKQFDVKLKFDVDTTGKVLEYADFRIRPYSLEESLTNVLSVFDFKYVKQDDKTFKIKAYEYPRRVESDGLKMLAFLQNKYNDKSKWEDRKACLKKEVREILAIDTILRQSVKSRPILSTERKYDGYKVQNFAIETLPGLYVNGSIYTPLAKGKHALILCPNGHWGGGRYNADEQTRFATLARMGAICVSYDLFGWGESELQVTASAHRTSVAHTMQLVNGLSILDFMLTQKNVDANRVGVNGGSGGGSQVVMLSVLDNRFTAACPVVSLASHFDGGCPCESGMPVSLACGGTNNAELMAAFAPGPLAVVSDDKDWTASVPRLEFPYLQSVYRFYDAENKVTNVHLAGEGHDFGVNKRKAVYNFFTKEFQLNNTVEDESKITIEKQEMMCSFGVKGEKMPVNAIRDFKQVEKFFNKKVNQEIHSNIEIDLKAQKYVDSLKLNDPAKTARVKAVIVKHMKAVRDWHNDHHFTTVPAGLNPLNGQMLTDVEREVIADGAMPKKVHDDLMSGLRKDLSEEQVEMILDFYTIGKVAFTMKGFKAIVPNMTETEETFIIKQLKLAREQAVDYKRMKAISAIFEIYKTNCERYLNENGRNWRQMYKVLTDKIKAEKAAKAAKEAEKLVK